MMSEYGNAIVTTRGYNPQNGRLNTIDARNALNQAVQYNTYGYDLLGNVTLRWGEGSGSSYGVPYSTAEFGEFCFTATAA